MTDAIQGDVEIRFGDGNAHRLGAGAVARVDAGTQRGLRNAGESDAIVLVAGGKDGYVGRDGRVVGGDPLAGGGPPGSGH